MCGIPDKGGEAHDHNLFRISSASGADRAVGPEGGRTMDLLNSFVDNPLGKWIIIVSAGVLSVILGVIISTITGMALERLGRRTTMRLSAIFIGAGRGHIVLWTVLLGVVIAADAVELPPKKLAILDKSCLALAILSLSLFVARGARAAFDQYAHRVKLSLPLSSVAEKLVTLIIMILGVMWILSNLGISITPILTALGVGSLAIALALQDTLTNFFAGLYIVAGGLVRPGDYVKTDSGAEGIIQDIGWRATRIRDLSNNTVIVPNGRLAQAQITNYDLPDKEVVVAVEAGVAYGSDLQTVEKVTVEVAREVLNDTPGGVRGFTPFIRYHTFGDSSVNFTVVLRVLEYADRYLITHEFIKRLHRRYKIERIEIPFPQRTVRLVKDGE